MVTRGDLEAHYGTLAPWDAHFVDLNREALNAFVSRTTQAVGGDPAQTSYAELFLQDLRYTDAFVTQAVHDLVIYSPAIAPTLASYDEVLTVGEVADEALEVRYVDGDVGRLTMPRYPDSGHSVCRDQPAKLHDDIRDFIAQDRR